jgi:hypothetical protein
MLPAKRIHQRKAKKLVSYLFVSSGLFIGVFAICVGIYVLRHKNTAVMSPLAHFGQAVFASSDSLVATQVEELCHKYSLSCQHISVKGHDEADLTIDNHLVILSTKKNIEQEIASLQLTIRALTMEGKGYRGLDFRYDRPVISH